MTPFILFAIVFFGATAFAQTTTTLLPAVPTLTGEDVATFLNAIHGWKGLGALGIAMIATQGTLLILKSTAINIDGKYKLIAVSLLTTIFGVLTLASQGVPIAEALLHAQTLTAIQVFAHQVYTQFFEKAQA